MAQKMSNVEAVAYYREEKLRQYAFWNELKHMYAGYYKCDDPHMNNDSLPFHKMLKGDRHQIGNVKDVVAQLIRASNNFESFIIFAKDTSDPFWKELVESIENTKRGPVAVYNTITQFPPIESFRSSKPTLLIEYPFMSGRDKNGKIYESATYTAILLNAKNMGVSRLHLVVKEDAGNKSSTIYPKDREFSVTAYYHTWYRGLFSDKSKSIALRQILEMIS